jgi:hypothetical protein
VDGLCVACAPRVRVLTRADEVTSVRAPVETHRRQVFLPLRPSQNAMARLVAVGPTSRTPQMVGELLAADKRISSFTALVPFVGPWLIQRSDVHSTKQKFFLTWLSVSLTTLLLWALISRLPTPEDRLAKLRSRIHAEMYALGVFADRHRAEHGRYPDEATWKRFAARADPRFFDPWGRPYRYQASSSDVTIATLGRDGVENGTDEDADFTARFHPAPAEP